MFLVFKRINDRVLAHKHKRIDLRVIPELLDAPPVTFLTIPKDMNILFTKLKELAGSFLTDGDLTFLNIIAEKLNSGITNLTQFEVKESWISCFKEFAKKLSLDAVFPLLDLIRVLLNSISFRQQLSNDPSLILLFIQRLDDDSAPRPALLVCLRLLCSLFVERILQASFMTENEFKIKESVFLPRELLIAVMVRTLLHDDSAVRRTAASLAWNVSGYVSSHRNIDESNQVESGDNWTLECISSSITALEHESDAEIIHRLLASFSIKLV